MAFYLSPIGNTQFVDSNGAPQSGAQLFIYNAGTSTKATTYKDANGNTPQSNPIALNASGRAASPIWLVGGSAYKFVLSPSNDTDPPGSPIYTWDNIYGINDSAAAVSEWVSGSTPTYISATQFTVAGDQTGTYQIGRRIKATVTAGTVYGYISASAYTTITTVTVVLDSGALDAGLSSVSLGLLTPSNRAYPQLFVSSIAALRAITGVTAPIEVLGYYTPGDGGGGQFYWDSASTAADDGGITILPTGYAGTGRWKRKLDNQPATPQMFGAKGDNSTDDTTALQTFLTRGGNLYIPNGTYIANPLSFVSNTTLTFHPNAKLYAKTGFGANDRFLNISQVSDVTIYGNHAVVQMRKSEYVTGEQRHGVFVVSSTNVSIYDLHSIDTGGDGFYVGEVSGSGVPSEDITLVNCYADNNRRQGLSIVSVIDCRVIGGEYSNTTGTAPSAGIDIEPNAGCSMQDVLVDGVKTSGNDGAGIIVVPRYLGNSASQVCSVTIRDCVSDGDAQTSDASFRFDNGAEPTNTILGYVSVENCHSFNAGHNGLQIGLIAWGSKCPLLTVRGMRILNPGNTGTASTYEAAGVSLYTGSATVSIDNVELYDIDATDTRGGSATMYASFYMSSNSTYKIADIVMENCTGSGQLLSDGPFVLLGSTKGSIRAAKLPTQSYAAGNYSVYRYPAYEITQSGNGVLTLPLAADYEGLEYTFRNTAATTLQVRPQTGDTIIDYGVSAGNDIVSGTTGDYVTLRSLGGTSWRVVAVEGRWRPLGNFVYPKYQLFYTAAPTSGTWAQGDRVLNSAPASGESTGWVCVSAGTPGTWRPFGMLWSVSTDKGNADATLTHLSSDTTNIWNTALTADRAVTLSTTGAINGAKFRIVRTANATGAFNLNVGTGPLKAMATAGSFCEVEYNGSAWVLTAYGTL